MREPAPPAPGDCFHCPQGDRPDPNVYERGAWLTKPAAEPPSETGADRDRAGEQAAPLRRVLPKLPKRRAAAR